MNIKDEYIVILSIILLLLTVYSLYNIYQFKPINEKCDISFQVINKCHCIPDKNLAELFNLNYTFYNINYTQIRNEIGDIPLA